MATKWKIALVVLGVLLTGAAGAHYTYLYKVNQGLKTKLLMKSEQFDAQLGRATATIADLRTLNLNLHKKFQQAIEQRNEALDEVTVWKGRYEAVGSGSLEVGTPIVKESGTPSVNEEKTPTGPIYVEVEKEVYREIESLPIKFQDFRLTFQGDAVRGVYGYQLHLTLEGQVVETTEEDGQEVSYVAVFELGPNGERIGELHLESVKVFKEDKRQESWNWMNPKLHVSIFAGLGGLGMTAGAMFDVTLSSYGLTEDDNKWRLFGLGVGVDMLSEDVVFSVAPARYNVSKHVPLLSDVWLGLGGQWALGNQWGVTFSLGSTL